MTVLRVIICLICVASGVDSFKSFEAIANLVKTIAGVGYKFKENIEYNLHPDAYKTLRKTFRTPAEADLWVVGTYIAAHKFYGVDERYQIGERTEEEMTFYYKFPNPPLKEMFGPIKEACETNVLSCIETVKTYAMKSATLKYIRRVHDPSVPLHAPFVNAYDMFRVRQTAAYYLCWFALQKEPAMAYGSNLTCFSYLHTVADIIPEEKRESWIKDKKVIKDERENSYLENPFRCSELWFCPDPCYGKKTHGIKIEGDEKSNEGNPCKGLKDDTCEWMEGANSNFKDLTRNRLNSTCRCSSSTKGYKWIPQFQMCADADECYGGDYYCPSDKVCKNTIGGYKCQCQRGYTENKETHICEPMSLLRSGKKLLRYNPDINKPKEEGLFDEIEEFLGFSSAKRYGVDTGMKIITVSLIMLFLIKY